MKKTKLTLKSLSVSSFTTTKSIKGGGNSTFCPTIDVQCAASADVSACVDGNTNCVIYP